MRSDDPTNYQATIFGPVDSPFEGGIYLLIMCNFLSSIHPNIDVNGNIYMNIFYDQWTPMLSIEKVLLEIQSLLILPEVNVPSSGNKEAARLYMQDRDKYDEYVRLH